MVRRSRTVAVKACKSSMPDKTKSGRQRPAEEEIALRDILTGIFAGQKAIEGGRVSLFSLQSEGKIYSHRDIIVHRLHYVTWLNILCVPSPPGVGSMGCQGP